MFHHHISEVSAHDRFRFISAEYMMEILQREKYFGEPHTCHILARVVAPLLEARVVTGAVFTLYKEGDEAKLLENDHSWIEFDQGWVLDLKPVGIMSRGPILVDAKPLGPGYLWYHRYDRWHWPKEIQTDATKKSIHRMRRALADVLVQKPLSKTEHTRRFHKLIS